MADNVLEIIITATADKAKQSVEDLKKSLDETAKSADDAGKKMSASNKALDNTTKTASSAFSAVSEASSAMSALSSAALGAGAGILGAGGIYLGTLALKAAFEEFKPAIDGVIPIIGEFENALQEAAGKAAKQFIQAADSFNQFLQVSLDVENSAGRQNAAFDKANGLLKEYGIKIKDLNTFQSQGAKIGSIYAEIKQEEAKATVIAAKAAEEYAKRIVIQTQAQQGDVLGVFGQLSSLDKLKTIFGGGLGSVTAFAQGFNNAINSSTETENLYNKELDQTRKRKDDLIKSLLKITGVTENYDKSSSKLTESLKNQSKATKDQSKILNEQLTSLTSISDKEGSLAQQISFIKDQERNQQLKDRIKSLTELLKIQKDGIAVDQGAVNAAIKSFQEFEKADADRKKKQKDTGLKSVAEDVEDAYAAFSLLSPAIDAAFNSLANGTNIADAVGQAVKDLVIQLIKAVAQAAILSLILSVIGGPAALAKEGGFGGIFGKLLGFKANGGGVLGNKPYIVGERGPELFLPNTSGSIVPNMALAGGAGGNVSFEIRGDVLYGLLRRTANNKMANFG